MTVENLAPANGVSFAPLRLGFNSGTFDAFNLGQAAGPAIVSVAEGGSAGDWFPAFAADPTTTLGSVGGALTPGSAASNTFTVDTASHPYFTFGAMVVPSNDFFIGNDSPTAFRPFDAGGNLLISDILQRAGDIWDAGSETFDPLAAAFLTIGTNDLRTPQNGVVNFNFAELSGFNGLETAAGYTLDSQLRPDSEIYRISFAVTQPPVATPAPPALVAGLLGVGSLLGARRLRRG